MKAELNIIKLEKLYFETGDSTIQIITTVFKGRLSYQSEMILPSNEINRLLNTIQKQVSENIEVSAHFDIEKMYDGNQLYSLDLTRISQNSIEIQDIFAYQNVKQIRA